MSTVLDGARARLRELELLTRPVAPELAAALARRWDELPAHVKTPEQALGRRLAGCEGTHGVFPRCNLACTPCYHSRDANRVRVDADHTIAEIDAQMTLLEAIRGPGQNAQLIGGEVTLLGPEAHAAALETMRGHGRKPMSMSHGDFDYDYLERLAIRPDGTPRFGHLSFAGHFDSMMFGRRGIRRAEREADLNPYRARFCEMFARLEREHGVTSYLAHNMTVTPANAAEIPTLIRDCRSMGFRMFSFQPAAFIGNQARWKGTYRALDGDDIWALIEDGAGARLPDGVFQVGDRRCNRTAHGGYVGDNWVPILDDAQPGDLKARDAFYETFGPMDFEVPGPILAAKLARALAAQPGTLAIAPGFAARFISRAGGLRALRRHGFRAVTFVMHSFMDAAVVAPAWSLMREGLVAEDPEIRATQERLAACSYAMAHPETGELIPACAQHSVYDPAENAALTKLLPMVA